MNTTQPRPQHRPQHPTTAVAAILTATLLALVAGTLPAQARQDPGPAAEPVPTTYFCAPQRVGTQFVGCDNLTGNGVPAPAWVDER